MTELMTVARLRALLAEMPGDLEVRLDDNGDGRLDQVELGEVFPVDMSTGAWGEPQHVVFLRGVEGEVAAEPVANLLVLYVSDLAESLRFYELLGLEFVREQHGDGVVHYAATLPGGMVLELYPAATGIVSRVRLGLTVPDRHAVVERLRAAHFTVKRSDLVVDPDGNRVQLAEADRSTPRR